MKINLVFFGSSEFSVYVLDELKLHHILPKLIVTTPDKPKGRKLVVTPTPVKIWAQKNNIKVLDPTSLKNNPTLSSQLSALSSKLFLVASYGKIIPKKIFDIPEYKTLNIHPSLLPKYRGASPIQSQVLYDNRDVGVTIIKIIEEMDAGPIISKKDVNLEEWPIGKIELEKKLAIEGARLFIHILPEWISGVIQGIPQDDSEATYCKKIKKEFGLLDIDLNDLSKNSYKNLLKIKAFEDWPRTYFIHNGKRVIIKEASIDNSKLKITKVIPEGKKEMTFEDFLRGFKKE